MAKLDDMRARARLIPEMGKVKGGRLDGWRYRLLHVVVAPGELLVLARCTPPAWPFPRDIYMDHTHFASLRPVTGDRAKRIPQAELLRRAFEVEKLPVPAYVLDPSSTLRAIVKRGNRPVSRKP